MVRSNALSRLAAELRGLSGRRGRRVLEQWADQCALLADAGLGSPGEVPGWVWSLAPGEADAVLRVLVEQAQSGDALAAAALLVCLRPGMCALAVGTGLPVDEIVSEAAFAVLRFPVARRASVAGQILLDVRRAVRRQRERQRDVLDGDTRVALEGIEASGELGVEQSTPETLVALVAGAWRAGELGGDDARLILETRVAGDAMTVAAARRSVSRTAAYQRRQRAEARLARWLR